MPITERKHTTEPRLQLVTPDRVRGEPLAVRIESAVTCLAATAISLVLAHLALQAMRYFGAHDTLMGMIDLFDVDVERNVPTLFSTAQLLLAAGVAACIALVTRREREPNWIGWTFVAAGILYLACDEFMGLHERLVAPMQHVLGARQRGVLYQAWIVPAGIAVSIAALSFRGFVRTLPDETRRRLLVAVCVFLSGAIGMEMLGGLHIEAHGMQNFPYQLFSATEELLEMLGVTLAIGALLRHLRRFGPLEVRLTS